MNNLTHHFSTCYAYSVIIKNPRMRIQESFLSPLLHWTRQLFLGIPSFISPCLIHPFDLHLVGAYADMMEEEECDTEFEDDPIVQTDLKVRTYVLHKGMHHVYTRGEGWGCTMSTQGGGVGMHRVYTGGRGGDAPCLHKGEGWGCTMSTQGGGVGMQLLQ